MTKEFMEEMAGKIAAGSYTREELSVFLGELETLDEVSYARLFNMIYASLPDKVQGEIDPLLRVKLEAKLDSTEKENNPPVVFMQPRRRLLRWSAAAAVLLLLTGIYLISLKSENPPGYTAQYKQDVQPGHSGAVLHLSDGTTIVLDSVQDGAVAKQGNIRAVKANGQLSYTGHNDEIVYNDITTDKGRQWQLALPDGTKVWLNAASSIHYPLTFNGHQRVVEMTGEAYFEVAHNVDPSTGLRIPFKVKAGKQVIEDIGTSFNVNAYTDEPAARTTITEGMVQIRNERVKAGQQAVFANDGLTVVTADTEKALAWKNGLFNFDNADIHTVMRELARWYNVEVKFEGSPDNTAFGGEIGRTLTLSQVLKGLEQVHVHFRIEEGKRIVILP